MKKSDSGSLVFWGLALMVIPLWIISFPVSTIRHNLNPLLVYVSQLTALTGFSMFALTFVLSVRWRWMEDYFGGLDKMYHLHHTMARTALVIYLAALSVTGVTAWVYKSVLFDWIIEKPRYRVEIADRLNVQVIEITMTPENERGRFIPGQYFFFSFRDSDLSRKSHPFTVCDEKKDGQIKIMVKVLGFFKAFNI